MIWDSLSRGWQHSIELLALVLSELKDEVEGIDPLLSVRLCLRTHDHVPLVAPKHKEVLVIAVNLTLLDLRVYLNAENVLDINDFLFGVRLFPITEQAMSNVKEEIAQLKFVHIQVG